MARRRKPNHYNASSCFGCAVAVILLVGCFYAIVSRTPEDWAEIDAQRVETNQRLEAEREKRERDEAEYWEDRRKRASEERDRLRELEAKRKESTVFGKRIVATFEAKLIRVVDGDTVELLFPDKTHPNCRLESLDAPETGSKNVTGQPFANNATEAIKNLCGGRMVTVRQTGVDGYKRPLVFIEFEGVNLNAEGLAWHYKKYSSDESLAQLEVEARNAKRGLWGDSNPISPWRWRKRD